MESSGALFVGGTNRGWGSRGAKEFSVERLQWTGKVPFEIRTLRSRPTGFRLSFTKPVDRQQAGDVASYSLQTYTYIYQEQYGSPEVDRTQPLIRAAQVSDDGLQVELTIEGLQLGHVHELHAKGVRAVSGEPLLHSAAYYTLNNMPKE